MLPMHNRKGGLCKNHFMDHLLVGQNSWLENSFFGMYDFDNQGTHRIYGMKTDVVQINFFVWIGEWGGGGWPELSFYCKNIGIHRR